MCVRVTHGLGMLSVHSVAELQQGLKLIVSGERDDLQHGAKLTEDLKKNNSDDRSVNDAAETNKETKKQRNKQQDKSTPWTMLPYLLQDLQRHWVKQILHNDSQDGTLTGAEAPPLPA